MPRRISRVEAQGLIGESESVEIGLWFVAERYWTWQGVIYPQPSRCRRTQPLSDPELFLSFARLGAHGHPSDESILRWVHIHGLLRRKDPAWPKLRLGDGTPNQAPMALEEFRGEVRQAYGALTLLQHIRGRDCDELRVRMERKRIYYRNVPVGYRWKDGRSRFAAVLLDGEHIPGEVQAEGELSDEDVLAVAVRGLEYLVEQRLRDFGVELGFTTDFHHPRPLSPSSRFVPQYRPRLTPRCPNLGGTLWYQFAALMEDKRPLRNCPECGLPFVGRADKKTCSDACRQAKSRRGRQRLG